jgi:hypothetical protein
MEDKDDATLFERFIYSPFGILAVLAVSAFAAVAINQLLGY